MADSDKDILITPNKGETGDPTIEFRGADASTSAQEIELKALPDSSGTLSFEGSAGQLFSINNNLEGVIFSVNNAEGFPIIEADDEGLVRISDYTSSSSVVSPSLSFNFDRNTGFYITESDDLAIAVEGQGIASYGKGDAGDPELTIFGPFLAYDLRLDKSLVATGTTGAATINAPAGSVNFAASATSLVVTNDLVDESSIIIATVASNDSTMNSVQAVPTSGSFTLYPDAAPTSETRVNFTVIN